jgi:hypothetical protein
MSAKFWEIRCTLQPELTACLIVKTARKCLLFRADNRNENPSIQSGHTTSPAVMYGLSHVTGDPSPFRIKPLDRQ